MSEMFDNSDKGNNGGRHSKAEKEKQLAQSVKNNDTLAFVELLGIYSRIISLMALSFNLPRDEFDDLCQEGRMALYRACNGYDAKGGAFSTYACACIKNAMTDFAARYGKQKSTESTVSIDDIATDKVSSVSVDEQVASSFLLSSVLDSDESVLSKKERAILGRRISGETVAEISKNTGDSEKAVQNALFRARTKLRRFLK